MERTPAKDQLVIAAIITYVGNHHHSKELFVSTTTADICWVLTGDIQNI